jgi:hypothetical protein
VGGPTDNNSGARQLEETVNIRAVDRKDRNLRERVVRMRRLRSELAAPAGAKAGVCNINIGLKKSAQR